MGEWNCVIFNFGTRWRRAVSITPRLLYALDRDWMGSRACECRIPVV